VKARARRTGTSTGRRPAVVEITDVRMPAVVEITGASRALGEQACRRCDAIGAALAGFAPRSGDPRAPNLIGRAVAMMSAPRGCSQEHAACIKPIKSIEYVH